MRGFLVGSFALIVAYAVVQTPAARRIAAANDALAGLVERWLSSDVAGVPDLAGDQGGANIGRAGSAGSPSKTPPPPGGGGGATKREVQP
jgi:hypothetical protein